MQEDNPTFVRFEAPFWFGLDGYLKDINGEEFSPGEPYIGVVEPGSVLPVDSQDPSTKTVAVRLPPGWGAPQGGIPLVVCVLTKASAQAEPPAITSLTVDVARDRFPGEFDPLRSDEWDDNGFDEIDDPKADLTSHIAAWTEPYLPTASPEEVKTRRSPQSSMATVAVYRGRKGVGRYLVDYDLLIVDREEDREVVTRLLEASGYRVRQPLRVPTAGEQLLRLKATGLGAWGEVLLFEGQFGSEFIPPARVAIYLLDREELHTVNPALRPGVETQLALMGLAVRDTGQQIPARLKDKLHWEPRYWGKG